MKAEEVLKKVKEYLNDNKEAESLDIQGICDVIWTQSVKDAWRSNLIHEKYPYR